MTPNAPPRGHREDIFPKLSRIVVASADVHIVGEFRDELAPHGIAILTLADVGLPEPGAYRQSAIDIATGKAAITASLSGCPAVGVVSSFNIDALRRYGGGGPAWSCLDPSPDLPELLAFQLKRINDSLAAGGYCGPDDRGAYFQCVICLAWPDGETTLFQAEVDGQLASLRDQHPLTFARYFVPEGESAPLAEMTAAQQRAYSHRRKAIRLLGEFCA